jgi:hypothetical protein
VTFTVTHSVATVACGGRDCRRRLRECTRTINGVCLEDKNISVVSERLLLDGGPSPNAVDALGFILTSRGFGWRIHFGVKVTELSTNTQHTLSGRSFYGPPPSFLELGLCRTGSPVPVGGNFSFMIKTSRRLCKVVAVSRSSAHGVVMMIPFICTCRNNK